MSPTREPIGSPPPRRHAKNAVNEPVRNLLKSNRVQGPARPEQGQAPVVVLDERKKQITFYIKAADRQRAKAAYQATSGQEGDQTWSDFITRALMNEVERREAAYNDGEPFPGGAQNLAPGRKLAP